MFIFAFLLTGAAVLFPFLSFASETVGTVSASDRFAWSENLGWINFAAPESDVLVTDTAITGYAWNENYGWINLSPTQSGVSNDGEGNLDGQAWGENIGWIDFDNVTIGTTGVFSGTAQGGISGTITFDCDHCLVQTDWRPASTRGGTTPEPEVPGGSSGGWMPPKAVATSTPEDIIPIDLYPTPPGPIVQAILDNEIIQALEDTFDILIPDFIKERLRRGEDLKLSLRDLLPKYAPDALSGLWNLIPPTADRFALQPLPGETRLLAQKFPQLSDAFDRVGISRMADVGKLTGAKLALPGFSQIVGLSKTKVVAGKFSLLMGVPTADLTLAQKRMLPTETIFARALDERLDLKTNLTFSDQGRPIQQISTIVGKTLNLVVKPEAPVRKVTGYIVLSKRQNGATAIRLPMNSLAAAAMFASPSLAQKAEVPEKKFVLSEFEYEDIDGDGIYTASVTAPVVSGEYEVITVMDYLNPDYGSKEIRLIAVVDPEGYVFAKNGKYESRISEATVSIYWLNEQSGDYELWPAKEYLQTNPQRTDARGTYSFLVPEGSYYLAVEAGGFKDYLGEPFMVEEGNGVHVNVELVDKGGWLPDFLNLNTLIIILIGLAVLYRLYWSPRQSKYLN